MRKRKTADKLVERFNSKFPIGSKVRWRSMSGDVFKEMTVAYPAYLHFGMAVAFFQEHSGLCSIDPLFVDYTYSPTTVED